MKKLFLLLFSLLTSYSAGFIGSIFTSASVNTWYPTLVKPSFTPPSWLFGPIWTFLYTLIGISLFLILKNKKKILRKNKTALIFFAIQWLLNAAWSVVFFGLQSPIFAFVIIEILIASILITVYLFYKINKTAGLILLPYLFWTFFASILNFYLWKLN